MWAVWILITIIVTIINISQLLSILFAYFMCRPVYDKLPQKQKRTYAFSFVFHFAVILTWIVLCATIDAINKYWIVNLITWILCFAFAIIVVLKSKRDILSGMVNTAENLRQNKSNDLNESEKIDDFMDGMSNTQKLSYSQVVNMITNLMDAKKNLNEIKYGLIKALYDEWRLKTEKKVVDQMGYLEMCEDIITSYEMVAPYKLFDGNISRNLTFEEVQEIWEAYDNGERFFDDMYKD